MSISWETPGSGTGSPARRARTSCFPSLSPSADMDDVMDDERSAGFGPSDVANVVIVSGISLSAQF